MAYSDPTGYDVFVAFQPDGAGGFGRTFIVTFNPGGSNAEIYSWTNINDKGTKNDGFQWPAFHRGLLRSDQPNRASNARYNNQTFFGFHIRANAAATKAMGAVFEAANASHEHYNFFSNNCAEMVQRALNAGAKVDPTLQNAANIFNLYPNMALLALAANVYAPENISDLETAEDIVNAGDGNGAMTVISQLNRNRLFPLRRYKKAAVFAMALMVSAGCNATRHDKHASFHLAYTDASPTALVVENRHAWFAYGVNINGKSGVGVTDGVSITPVLNADEDIYFEVKQLATDGQTVWFAGQRKSMGLIGIVDQRRLAVTHRLSDDWPSSISYSFRERRCISFVPWLTSSVG